MAKSTKGGYNKTKATAYYKQLGADLTKLSGYLSNLKTHILQIENGDGKSGRAYWSGRTAKNYIITLKKHYNHHVSVYNKLYDVYTILKARVSTSSRRIDI